MAILKADEIRAMTREEMIGKLKELRAELTRARTTIAAGGTVENTARAKELRRTIARLLTIINEKQGGV
jgi:large subunit ribosomal protein L29